MSNHQELAEEQKLLSVDRFLSYCLCSCVGRNYSSTKYKYLARTSLRQISLKTMLDISEDHSNIKPQRKCFLSILDVSQEQVFSILTRALLRLHALPFSNCVLLVFFERCLFVIARKSNSSSTENQRFMFIESKYSGNIYLNGQIFKLF